MLLKPIVTVALRCPVCGRMNYHEVTLFSFSGTSLLTYKCECGHHTMSVGKKKGMIWLEVSCALCEESHLMSFGQSEFWSPEPRSLYCTDTEVEVGFIGAAESVRGVVRRYQEQVDAAMAEAGFYDFFDEPDIMYEVLHYLKGWAEGGSLSCPCGNRKIEVNINPDRLELKCHTCGRFSTLPATSRKDVEALRSMEVLGVYERGKKLFSESEEGHI